MRRLGICALTLIILLSCVTPALSAVDPENFRYQSDVNVSLTKKAEFFVLDIDPGIYATMDPTLKDLRIYSAGKELGYALLPHEPTDTPAVNTLPVEIINKGMIQGTDTYSFTLKLPPARPGAVQIKLNQPEYLVKARLSGSSDNKTWQILKTMTLYGIQDSYNKFYLEGIDYQYLKFEYDLLKNQILEVIEAVITEGALPKKTETSWEIKQRDNNGKKTTTVNIDLGYNNRINRGITLKTGEKGFYRQVSLAASNDQKTWNNITTTYLYRGQDNKDENLGIDYAPVQGRYLKITVENEDNPPVRFTGSKVQISPVRLLVKSPGRDFSLTLYWGNKKLNAPSYDVAYVLARSDQSANVKNISVVNIKIFKVNDGYKEALPPLTERLPWLMPAALGIAALLVVFILFRSFKHVER